MDKSIILEKINKTYRGKEVLKNINLEVKRGEFICIFGESGSGKTTLLNIIGTLEKYDGGNLTLFNQKNPTKSNRIVRKLRRDKIAYLFQNFALIDNMTVEENINLAKKYSDISREEIKEILQSLGILDKLKEKIYTLSGGEQQRVALARNLVKPFDILLADEPTGSLDGENKKIVMENLIKINKLGKSILVVTHDKEFMDISQKNYCLIDGKLELL